jgi:hypothetical protein
MLGANVFARKEAGMLVKVLLIRRITVSKINALTLQRVLPV